jgi:hypothetical protein
MMLVGKSSGYNAVLTPRFGIASGTGEKPQNDTQSPDKIVVTGGQTIEKTYTARGLGRERQITVSVQAFTDFSQTSVHVRDGDHHFHFKNGRCTNNDQYKCYADLKKVFPQLPMIEGPQWEHYGPPGFTRSPAKPHVYYEG